MTVEERVGQRNPHPVQIRPTDRVLKARQGWLRSQRFARHRVAIAQQLLDRVATQPACIIGVRITAGNRVQALAHQIPKRVLDLARLTSISEAAYQRLGQPQSPVARLQQDRTAVGTGMLLVKPRHHRLARQIRKQDTLSCAIVCHEKAS